MEQVDSLARPRGKGPGGKLQEGSKSGSAHSLYPHRAQPEIGIQGTQELFI